MQTYAAKGGTRFCHDGENVLIADMEDDTPIPLSDLLEFAAHLRAGPLCAGCGAPADTLRHGKCIDCWTRGQEPRDARRELPKEGERVLALFPEWEGRWNMGRHYDGIGWRFQGQVGSYIVTHWMPLPPQPADQGGEEMK